MSKGFQKIEQRTLDAAHNADILAVVERFVTDLKKKGKDYKGTCPRCNKEALSVVVTGKKAGVWSCFHCQSEFSGKGPVAFVEQHEGLKFPESIKRVCDICNIPVEYESQPEPQKPKKLGKKPRRTGQNNFRDQQLLGSGLTNEDSLFRLGDQSEHVEIQRYESGTRTDHWRFDPTGTDMVLRYLNLDGTEMMVTLHKRRKAQPFFRVRYQYPEHHLDRNGKAKKYDQPYGSDIRLWFPNKIIIAFQNGTRISDLHFVEGEKKADKMCKHGFYAIGISGIHNLGRDGQLPREVADIVSKCAVQRVYFNLDSDLFDLKLSGQQPIENRAKSFYAATRKFRDYFAGFRNHDIHIDAFLAYVKPGQLIDEGSESIKGVDDLYVQKLQGKENELIKDYTRAKNDGNGHGDYVAVHNLTGLSNSKLLKLWHLESPESFIGHHLDTLKELPSYYYGNLEWRINKETNKPELVSELLPTEQYWKWIHRRNKEGEITGTKFQFQYEPFYTFLSNRGYYLHRMLSGEARLCKIEDKCVELLPEKNPEIEVQRYVLDFTRELNEMKVLQHLHASKARYLGIGSLTALPIAPVNFIEAERDRQFLYFKNVAVEITPEYCRKVEYNAIPGHIWKTQQTDFNPTLINDFLKVQTSATEGPLLIISPEAMQSDYFLFLVASSLLDWDEIVKRIGSPLNAEERDKTSLLYVLEHLTDDERKTLNVNLLNKITGIGYLAHRYRNPLQEKAVIGMDATETPIGESHGRSGKSLIGKALRNNMQVATIDGKKSKLEEDQFLLEGVTERTELVAIDDVRPNFDFTRMFSLITGEFEVNPKHGKKFTIPYEKSPKLYISTNHQFNAQDGSSTDRQFIMPFSNWYSDEHKPFHDFGRAFFQEWEYDQWNLYHNLVAYCIHVYLNVGLIECPVRSVVQRQRRQIMGEAFLNWAVTAFDSQGEYLNREIDRQELYQNCLEMVGKRERAYLTPHRWLKKLKVFCEYAELNYCPHTPDGKLRKSGSTQYIVVGNDEFDPINMDPNF